jgi:hypothetical protein
MVSAHQQDTLVPARGENGVIETGFLPSSGIGTYPLASIAERAACGSMSTGAKDSLGVADVSLILAFTILV